MDRILNQLYRSEIKPDEDERPILEELMSARKCFAARREKLLSKMEEPACTDVRMLLEERMEVSALEMEDAYVRGMRMGARMAVALLGNQKDLPDLN